MKLRGGKYRAAAKANIISPEIFQQFGGRYLSYGSRQYPYSRTGQGCKSPTGSKMTARYYKELSMNSGEPIQSHTDCTIKPIDGKIAQNMYRQSDYPILSGKPMKVGGEKGIAANTWEVRDTSPRLRTGAEVRTKLTSLTQRAKENPKAKFTSLAHLLTEDFLTECFGELKRDKASGIDRVSVDEYGKDLEENIKDLVKRLKEKSLSQREAARILGVSVRHVVRLFKAYLEKGTAGLVSQRRGRESNNRLSEATRVQALDLLGSKYRGFGPTLACEYS